MKFLFIELATPFETQTTPSQSHKIFSLRVKSSQDWFFHYIFSISFIKRSVFYQKKSFPNLPEKIHEIIEIIVRGHIAV